MANQGNAWHIPSSGEPRGHGGMRDPVGPVVPGAVLALTSGNQYQGQGNPGNQLQNGSLLHYRRDGDAGWTALPLVFEQAAGNNKYFTATVPADTFAAEDVVGYYFEIAYNDHDTTFLHAAGGGSTVTDDEAAARGAAFSFTLESSAVRGRWGDVFPLPNVAIHAHLLHAGRVLFWGRRDRPDQSLDLHVCTPFLWTGRVTAVVGHEVACFLPGVVDLSVTVDTGDAVTATRSSHDRYGYVIAVAPDAAGAERAVDDILDHLRLELW